MMSYITPRFLTLAFIITMLFGGYNGIPCNKVENNDGRQAISEVPLTASPSGLLSSQNYQPPRDAKPIPGGLVRRMMKKGGGMPKPPGGE